MTGTETKYMTIQHKKTHIWNRIQLSLRKKSPKSNTLIKTMVRGSNIYYSKK